MEGSFGAGALKGSGLFLSAVLVRGRDRGQRQAGSIVEVPGCPVTDVRVPEEGFQPNRFDARLFAAGLPAGKQALTAPAKRKVVPR